MSDFRPGTSQGPDDRLKGEVMASLSEWTAEYGLVRLELGWTVANMLLKHVSREQPIGIYVEFIERLADILGEEAKGLREILADEVRLKIN